MNCLFIGHENVARLPNTPVPSGSKIPFVKGGDRGHIFDLMHLPKSIRSPVKRLQKYPSGQGSWALHFETQTASCLSILHSPEE